MQVFRALALLLRRVPSGVSPSRACSRPAWASPWRGGAGATPVSLLNREAGDAGEWHVGVRERPRRLRPARRMTVVARPGGAKARARWRACPTVLQTWAPTARPRVGFRTSNAAGFPADYTGPAWLPRSRQSGSDANTATSHRLALGITLAPPIFPSFPSRPSPPPLPPPPHRHAGIYVEEAPVRRPA